MVDSQTAYSVDPKCEPNTLGKHTVPPKSSTNLKEPVNVRGKGPDLPSMVRGWEGDFFPRLAGDLQPNLFGWGKDMPPMTRQSA